MTLTAAIFLAVLVVALAVFGVFLTRRVQYVLVGRPEARHDRLGTRTGGFVVYVLGQKKLFKEPVGIVHFVIFWGFIVIAFGTLQIIGEGLWEAFSLPAIGAWPVFYLVLDVLMVLVLVAIVVAIVYRYVVRPPRLEASLEAAVILALIFGLVAAALVYSGFAYALEAHDKYALAPVTGALAALFGPLDDGATQTAHAGLLVGAPRAAARLPRLHPAEQAPAPDHVPGQRVLPQPQAARRAGPAARPGGRGPRGVRRRAASSSSRAGSSWTCTRAPSAAAARTTAPRGSPASPSPPSC